MANFTALKTAIQNAIKQNGNEEITGDVLQQILLSIVSTMGDGSINTIEQNLSQETLARQNGDNTLQSNINAEALARGNADTQLQNAINAIKANIDNGYVYAGIATPSSTPVSGKVFYIATAAGTYTNFGGQVLTQGINILRFNGSEWSSQQLIGIDDVPTAGSNNLAKSGGVQNELALGAVYDVSAKNPTAGPNNDGKWESLSTLLSDANLNTLIPTAYRKGGMSIKFVHSSDNNYVKFFCTADEFTTDTTQWQGVDDVPTAGSMNLVESGGVAQYLAETISAKITPTTDEGLVEDYMVNKDGSKTSANNFGYVQPIPLPAGATITLNEGNNVYWGNVAVVYECLQDGTFIKQLLGDGNYTFKPASYINATGNDMYVGICTYKHTLNYRISSLAKAASDATVKANEIKGWILGESYTLTNVTYTDGIINSPVSVTWPDGVSGALTVVRNSEGLVTSVTATHGTDTYVLTVTRNNDGNATNTTIIKQ